jgi:hypothetical protein
MNIVLIIWWVTLILNLGVLIHSFIMNRRIDKTLRRARKLLDKLTQLCPKCNEVHDLECEECEPEYANKAAWEESQRG